MNFIGIIPARYGSTRFPGKPLAMLGGKPVIQHVYERACQALDTVVVATDDERIACCVRGFGGEVIMTGSECRCGTERCAEALQTLLPLLGRECPESEIGVINIQGDEPFIDPEQIRLLMALFPTDIATLATPLSGDATDPNRVKVVISERHEALYFSRSPIPYGGPYYKHIGLYAYRMDVLKRIVQLPPAPLELTERLEQLRWLDAGYTIRVALTPHETIGIDTPADLHEAEQYLLNSK